MINPFNSNNNQFLFKKNYQLLSRPTPEPAVSQYATEPTLNYLQQRNPFRSTSPSITLKNSQVGSPSRPLSISRAGPTPGTLSRISTASNLQAFKPKGLLEAADGWKRDIEVKQRQKVQVYGAEGLRYNAYLPEPSKQPYEYYEISKPIQTRQARSPAVESVKSSPYDSATNYYLSPRNNLLPNKPNRRELFEDEIEELSPNFNLIDPRKRDSNSGSGSSGRKSKINDMFDSQFDDRLKRSMQYGSIYGGIAQDDMLDSRKQGSRFKESGPKGFPYSQAASVTSELHPEQSQIPKSIRLQGQVYYRMPL